MHVHGRQFHDNIITMRIICLAHSATHEQINPVDKKLLRAPAGGIHLTHRFNVFTRGYLP